MWRHSPKPTSQEWTGTSRGSSSATRTWFRVRAPRAQMACLCWVLVTAVWTPPTIHAQERTVRVFGTVTNATSGLAVRDVSVMHRGSVVATTDDDGAFETPPLPVQGTQLALLFQRVGYAPLAHVLDAPPLRSELHVQLAMDQLPTELETIVVEGQRIVIRNPGLVGFYNRREEGFGRYLTEAEIDRAKSFDLTPYMRRLRTPTRCPLVVYLDGIRMPSLEVVNELVPPPLLGGIELYADERKEQLPREFTPAGLSCGVILFWTRDPKGPSPIEVGVHYAAQLTGEGSRTRLFGGRMIFPLRGGSSTLHIHVGFDMNLEEQGDDWYFSLTPAVRPLGGQSRWYVGTGLGLAKRQLGGNDEDVVAHHVLMTGVSLPLGVLGPFLEVRLLDPVRPSVARLFVFSGVNLRFGGN